MTATVSRETLVSFFRSAADLLESSLSKPAASPPAPALDHKAELDRYLADHAQELGTLVNWIRRKYESEQTPQKAASLLKYAVRQVSLVKAASTPHPEPTF